MPQNSRLVGPIVTTADLPTETVRSNPNLSKVTHFSNFAGDYHVGRSVAIFPWHEECGTHNHRGASEAFYVLAGYGIIEIDGTRYAVQQGDSVVVPVGSNHNLVGDSQDSEFTVLCDFIVAPGHEDDEYPWKPVGSE